MGEREILIEFDDSKYNKKEGFDVVLKVSDEYKVDKFVEVTRYHYLKNDRHDSAYEDVRTCLDTFREKLDDESIWYDREKLYNNYDDIKDKFVEFDNKNDFNYGIFNECEVITGIENNEFVWSAFVIDACFNRVKNGTTILGAGSNKIPKSMNFIHKKNSKKKFYARIEKIQLFKKDTLQLISEVKLPSNSEICVGFETPDCDYVIYFFLGDVHTSFDDRNIRYYNQVNNVKNIQHSSNRCKVVLYNLEECKIDIKTDSSFNDNVAPLLNYYTLLLNDLDLASEQKKIEVDLDLLRENYMLYADLIADEDLITLPIKGDGQRIKGISITTKTYSGSKNKYDFYESNISTFSKEDLESHIQALKESGVSLPSKTSLVLLDLIDLYDKDKFLLKKLLNNGNLSKLTITNNVEGDRVRLKRIISGIENSLCDKVVNKSLIEIVCKNDIKDKMPKLMANHPYIKNDEYIDNLKKEYPILSENNEQLEAVDKIMQMDENNIDVMLVQGPPGTGKTELILALARELTKRKKKTLITSNVHVACDNVVERLKNNKDIVLKRYTAICGEQYEKEIVENERRYVENQILACFQHENTTIYSIEIYDDLQQQRKKLLERKDQIIKSKEDYDLKLAQYNEDKSNKKEIERKISANNDLLEEVEKEIASILEKIAKKEAKCDNYKSQIDLIMRKKEEKEKPLNNKKLDLVNLKKELNCLYNDNGYFEEQIGTFDKENKIILNFTSNFKTKLEEKNNYLSFLKKANLSDIKRNVLNYGLENTKLSDNEMTLVKNCLDEVIFLTEFRKKLENDINLKKDNGIFSMSTLEYVLYTVLKSDYCLNYLSEDTISDVHDIFAFYKLSYTKKVIMRLFPFVKINGHSYNFYNQCIKKLNDDLKKIQFNFQKIVFDIVEKVVSKTQIDNLIKDTENQIDDLKHKIIDNNSNIEKNERKISELEETIKLNKKAIPSKTNDVLECQKIIDEMEDELSSTFTKQINDNEIFLNNENKLLSDLKDSKEKKNKILDDVKEENDKFIKELSKIEDDIKQFENKSSDLINNYGAFLDRYNIDLNDVDKKIAKYNSTFERLDSKVELMVNNGWKKEEALDLIFNYVNELQSIIDCDPSVIGNYFNGRGSVFTNMFLLSDDNEESLISMTTSQVASLLNSTDSNELTFDYAIIDEASKCKFEDIIISLPRVRHLVLIGDFMQLDPMYDDYKNIDLRFQNIMTQSEWERMNRSTFSMLLSQIVDFNSENGLDDFSSNPLVAVMKRQYRMNKGIFNIIQPIYSIHKGFELIDEKRMTSNDVKCIEIRGNEVEQGTSYYNVEEGDAAVSILQEIKENKDKYPKIKSIGIITGYRAQQNYLVRKLKNFKIENIQVQIGTFDRFQGREYDLVIVSLVRTAKLGFTNNVRRMNVAFSRAKNHLLVLGDFTSLLKISRKIGKISDTEISNTDVKENNFVVKTLIPKLYDLKENFASTNDIVKGVQEFLKESNYEWYKIWI